jgi:hypothetical protein
MRCWTLGILALLALAIVCPTAIAQAAAEYGLGAGQAATTGATARKLGASLSDVFGTAAKAVQQGQAEGGPAPSTIGATPHNPSRSLRPKRSAASVANKPAAAELVPAMQGATQPPPAPVPVYEDPQKIEAGIAYDELVRRFGPPSMSITTGPGRTMLLYSREETSYQIEVEGGKVVAPRRE